jgi:hypothetical protein
MNLHHYLQSDIENEFIFDVYSRFIYGKQKGGNKAFKNGNKLQTYDFVKVNNNLFIGERRNACMTIRVNKHEAEIYWFGHVKNCAHWKNSKHMFLWGIIVLLKEFQRVKKILLGDDTKIKCKNGIHRLSKYYFLRYGKLYYELYFDFHIDFQYKYSKQQYEDALQKRETLKIKRSWVEDFLAEIKAVEPEFIQVFGDRNEILIADYLSHMTLELRKKYCDIFYSIITAFFDTFISISLQLTFYKNVDSDFIKYLKENPIIKYESEYDL